MSRIITLCVFLAFAACANSQVLPVSFCERYAAALFGNSSAPTQATLIQSVLNRAFFGGGGVVGILNQDMQKPFFNGSANGGGTNYYTDAVARASLVSKLNTFFQYAMACRATDAPAITSQMGPIHANMKITKAVWDQFVGEVGNTLVSFGVSSVTGPTSDLSYAVSLLGQFNRGAGTQQICNQADCAMYSPFNEFFVFGAVGAFRWFMRDGTSATMTIAANTTVHWNFAPIHNVRQTDANFDDLAGGFFSGSTGAGISSFLRTFDTPGTYYFVCMPHRTTMRGTIIVTGSTPQPSPAATSIPSAVAGVAVAIAAVLALRRF